MGKTIVEKIWENHIVYSEAGKPDLLYIDLHLVHEVTSPQAFEGLRLKQRKVRRPDLTFATMDHNVPTKLNEEKVDEIAQKQMMVLEQNCQEFRVPLAGMNHQDQGIVHVIGPELGLTQPGKTIVCGDSHTSTHGAFGALAFGIGTSEVEHVLSTQTLWQTKPKTMQIHVKGQLGVGVTAKDLILAIIAKYGIAIGTGYVVEYTGEAIQAMTMEERMTICNMSIEAGARAGLISPDETTFNYLKGRRYVAENDEFDQLVSKWKELATDKDAVYDKVLELDANEVEPFVTWGTNPSMGMKISATIPTLADNNDEMNKRSIEQALQYMGFTGGEKMTDIAVDYVFIGSCTNSRLSDLKAAASIIRGRKVHPNVTAIVVPGSTAIKQQAEKEGIDHIFKEAGFEWRDTGCSMCLAMNNDIVPAGKRCASTSNRNFEGRQGNGARTHLVSPQMAAAAAIEGKFVDVRKFAAEVVSG